ncbi:MAG TPA: L-2-amino-thiazoline-4-carboxylic acid hydrolase [Deltaproteobacteria bacterium]|nr:L-2-amino-thiazoline-4-carboxylic acid hydrolase [Deltaproteobacteria bacterium]
MDDLEREKRFGFSYWYMKDVIPRRMLAGHTYHTPGFGLAAQLFAVTAKHVMERLGPAEGEPLIRTAVEEFGRERGLRIAETVRSMGKPLTVKNWLIHSDIDGSNFQAKPAIDNHDLLVEVHRCSFMEAAEAWGLGDHARLYCRYVDHAILKGYNPAIRLVLNSRHDTGKHFCLFRYIMKETDA